MGSAALDIRYRMMAPKLRFLSQQPSNFFKIGLLLPPKKGTWA